MPESAYKIIELIGTSKESWEKGRIRGGQPRRKIPARPPCRRDRQARSATRRQGRGRGVPRQGERLVQVRGLKAIPRHCELEPSLGAKAPSVDERSHHRSPNPGDGFFLSRNDLNNLSIAHFLILSVAHACLMGLAGRGFGTPRQRRACRSPHWIKVKYRQHHAFSRMLDGVLIGD